MKPRGHQPSDLASFGSFCQDRSSFKTKLSLLSLLSFSPARVDKIILILEYAQVVSQIILLLPGIVSTSNLSDNLLTRTVLFFVRSINLSYLADFHQDADFSLGILLATMMCTILKYALCAYVIYNAAKNARSNSGLSGWSLILRVQGRVLCFFMTSLWVKAVQSIDSSGFSASWISNSVLINLSIIMIGLEYLFSLIIETQFCYILPTDNFLSSKGYRMQIFTLAQKGATQIIELTMNGNPIISLKMLGALNLVFSVARSYGFYKTLPLYNRAALFLQGDLINLVNSLAIACLLQALLVQIGYNKENPTFILSIWIAFSLFTIKASRIFLNKTMTDLLTKQIKGTPELLLHRIYAVTDLLKQAKPSEELTNLSDVTRLLQSSNDTTAQTGTNPDLDHPQNQLFDIRKTEDMNKLFLQYLETLSNKFPKNELIKLTLVQIQAKEFGLNLKASQIISEPCGIFSTNHTTRSLLSHQIEEMLSDSQGKVRFSLDLKTFVKNNALIDKLKLKVSQQLDFKIQICDNILRDKPDLGTIYDDAQSASNYYQETEKMIDDLYSILPDHHLEPLLLFSRYYQVVNCDPEKHRKYQGLYVKRCAKYQYSLNRLDLFEENLYQSTNAFLIFSAKKGKIMFCTQSIKSV